jgi:hypothetical protein
MSSAHYNIKRERAVGEKREGGVGEKREHVRNRWHFSVVYIFSTIWNGLMFKQQYSYLTELFFRLGIKAVLRQNKI